MSGNEDHHRQGRRFAARGNRHDERDPRDVEIERLRQRVRELEINPFDRYERQYEDTSTDSTVEEYENEGSEFENIFHQRHPRQRAPLQRHRRPSPAPPKTDLIRSLGIRTEIPEFEGRLCPDDFLDWLRTVDRIFDLRDTPDHIKVKLVAIRLKKSASLWWDHVQNQRYRKGKHRVESWDKMKRLMEKKFLPVTHKQDSYLEFHNLKQQTLTVEEFISEFERVRMRCGVEENEEQTIARFLGGLRTDISDVVYLQQYYSFHDVCRLALKVEKQLLAKQKTTTRFGSSSRAPQSATGPVRVGPIKAEPPALIGVSPTPTTSSLRCFKCQGIGHLKRDCPNKQVLTLIDEVDPLYDTEDEAETEVVYPDRAKGKVCTVIIDGGSCENMVSTTMVEKLVSGKAIRRTEEAYTLTPPPALTLLVVIIPLHPVGSPWWGEDSMIKYILEILNAESAALGKRRHQGSVGVGSKHVRQDTVCGAPGGNGEYGGSEYRVRFGKSYGWARSKEGNSEFERSYPCTSDVCPVMRIWKRTSDVGWRAGSGRGGEGLDLRNSTSRLGRDLFMESGGQASQQGPLELWVPWRQREELCSGIAREERVWWWQQQVVRNARTPRPQRGGGDEETENRTELEHLGGGIRPRDAGGAYNTRMQEVVRLEGGGEDTLQCLSAFESDVRHYYSLPHENTDTCHEYFTSRTQTQMADRADFAEQYLESADNSEVLLIHIFERSRTVSASEQAHTTDKLLCSTGVFIALHTSAMQTHSCAYIDFADMQTNTHTQSNRDLMQESKYQMTHECSVAKTMDRLTDNLCLCRNRASIERVYGPPHKLHLLELTNV
ncbi:reverse transcriptase domain-containing protein [Tanacetum coccineum]